ncbi:MAG: hypothetical protein ACK5S9_11175 [Roseiflexaceae bacterium]
MSSKFLLLLLVLSVCVSCTSATVVPTPEPIIIVVTNTPPPATATATASATASAVPSQTHTPSATTVPTETPLPSATTVPTATIRPSKTPRPTATVKVSCAAQAAPFKARVLAVRKAYRPLVDKVYSYTLELVDANFDEARVTAAFAGIDTIEVPACADVGEILYYFRLLRDTLWPAFIEMKIESNGRYPSEESFARVRSWHEEIKTFERNIDELITTIP